MSPHLDAFFDQLERHDEIIPLDELTALLKRLAVTPDELHEHIRFGANDYRRNLIRAGSAYQALVLCWRPGQASKIHDHRGSACGLRVLEGTARETIYTRGPDGMLVEGEHHEYSTGHVCGSMDADIHRIVNPSAKANLITLHVYSPPMLRAGVYRLDSPEVGEWIDPNAPTPTGALSR